MIMDARMLVYVTFIISTMIVIPKFPADEWTEYVATGCHGGVWCYWQPFAICVVI